MTAERAADVMFVLGLVAVGGAAASIWSIATGVLLVGSVLLATSIASAIARRT